MELLSVTMNDGVMLRSEIEGKDNSSEDKSSYKVVLKGDMVYNSMRMWQGASGISPYNGIVSPAYTVLVPRLPINNGYFAALFKSPNMINEFRKNSQGMTSDTWNLKYPQIKTIKVFIPTLKEQKRVAKMLRTLDNRIDKQAQLVDSLKKYKRGLLSAVFTRKLRFSNNEWETVLVSDVLKYEQPQKYIVDSENYSDSYEIPVLTANKAFILGYTNETNGVYNKGEVIIYDDFTMDMKYVSFPFKVKSSTIKILTAKGENQLYYLFSLLKSLNLKPEGHQRSYISIIEPLVIRVAPISEQKKIVSFLSAIDKIITEHESVLNKMKFERNALLQQLFI